jgi:hypothetical protein
MAKSVHCKLVDCDDETSTLTRYFPEARFVPIRSPLEIDALVQMALDERPAVLAVDLPARAGEEFQAWFSLVPFDELRAVGVTFTAVGVVAGSKDSIECILRWREFLRGGQVDWVIVLIIGEEIASTCAASLQIPLHTLMHTTSSSSRMQLGLDGVHVRLIMPFSLCHDGRKLGQIGPSSANRFREARVILRGEATSAKMRQK